MTPTLNKMKWVPLFLISVLLPTATKAEFECPGRTNCSCAQRISGDMELLCPQGIGPTTISATVIIPGVDVKIQCTNPEKWEQLRLLAGLQVGAVRYLTINNCPLPEVPYIQLMNSMGIPSTELLAVIRGNFVNQLTRKHLEGLTGTNKLNLDGNSLTELPEDIFKDLGELIWLDLKNNHLQNLKTIFQYIPKLEVLELGNNNISYLEPGTFRNLTKLRVLNLWSNNLKNVSRRLFTDVPNIENLELKSNKLINLPPDVFIDLQQLKEINLSANNFTSLPKGLFLSNLNLVRIQIHSNRRDLNTLPDGLFANLTKLQNILLNDCNLKKLPEDLLFGSASITNIALQRNSLSTLPEDFLKDNTKLEMINLSFNKLEILPDKLFQSTTELKILNMANNILTSISDDALSKLTKLEDLNLSNNQIGTISNGAFDKTGALKTINLSNNNIKKFEYVLSNGSPLPDDGFSPRSLLKSCLQLENIYLANNEIPELYWDWILSTRLQFLELYNNSISQLNYSQLVSTLGSRPTFDLSYNDITYIDMSVASLNDYQNKITVILKGNPIICDCEAYDLVDHLKQQYSLGKPVILDGTGLMCASGDIDLIGKLVKSVDLSQLTCIMNPCTDHCTCNRRPYDKALIVDCRGKGFEQLPPSMPTNETLENLDRLTNHTELNITNNRIKVVPLKLGPGYERINKIDLSYNNISTVNFSAFSQNLEIIHLDHNNISIIDPSSITALGNSTIKEITLNSNPWICNCQTLPWINYVRDNSKLIPDYNNVTCRNKHNKLLKEVKESEVCPLGSQYGTIIGIIIIAIIAIIMAIVTLVLHYLRRIKVWLYAHRMCLWFVTEEELDKDKIYDAFVSYSSLDENFVVDKLVPGLENGPTKYKLCLHYRDWIVGDFIPNQIARSVEESRRTLVVLSPNFLESVWGRMEFRAAHSQALSEGRARVILILYGDIGPTDKLDPELKAYISMNTYVKWEDPRFWDKLRYALPHPTELSKKGMPLIPQKGKRQKRLSHSENLINGVTGHNTLNSSITTPPADSIIIDPLKLIDNKPSKDI